MAMVSDADILDVVRRLRKTVADIDTTNFLAEQVKELHDPMLNQMIGPVIEKIQEAAEASMKLLKHIETNRSYKELVRKYRAPGTEEEGEE